MTYGAGSPAHARVHRCLLPARSADTWFSRARVGSPDPFAIREALPKVAHCGAACI